MKNKLLLINFLPLIWIPCTAQNWELVSEHKLKEQITAVSVDNRGLFYCGTAQGNMYRFAISGEEDEYYSELNNTSVTTVQAWNRMKVFNFFRDQQAVSILDRFTTTPKNIDLSELGVGYAWLFAPGTDHSFWSIESQTRELVKYDDQNLNVLSRAWLSNDIELGAAACLRAYKNLIILSIEHKGIYFFDQYGALQGIIERDGIKHFEILDGKIITLSNTDVLAIDPFNLQITDNKKAPEGAFQSVVIIGNSYIFFEKDGFNIYSYSD